MYLDSSPHFFRRIKAALLLLTLFLLLGAFFYDAPLGKPADPAQVPNPVKSAWFLLWIQELLSYSREWVYSLLGLGCIYLALPYLPFCPAAPERASWFPRDQRWINRLTVLVAVCLISLTVTAAFLRGENWRLVWPG